MLATGRIDVRPRDHSAGFTLIEMLVVIAVSVLVAGVLFPRIDAAIEHQAFEASATSVALGLTQARSAAIRTGQVSAFSITDGGKSFVAPKSGLQPLPSNARLSGSQPVVRFFEDGSGDAATIVLTASRHRRQFKISPDTGAIDITR